MFRISKSFYFEAAHVLDSAYSKACVDCIHGHSYRVDVEFWSESLNKDGMVTDFGWVKGLLKPIIEQWDHALLMRDSDERHKDVRKSFPHLVLLPFNVTAENMARHLHMKLANVLGTDTIKVTVWETSDSWASYEP